VFEAIRQGLDDAAKGRTRPAREVFAEIRRKHGIPS
jgi:predicted transcriptional regulator